MERDAFVARLRARAASPSPVAPEPAPVARAAPSLDRFQAELVGVGGLVTRVERGAAADAIASFARARAFPSFVAAATPLVDELRVADALAAAGLRAMGYPADTALARTALDDARLGVVEADLAIAESGTVCLVSDEKRGRLISCLPRALAVVLDPARLVARLEEAIEWLAAKGSLPSSLTLVTGPSRTGDIEGSLVLGAHGPATVHVFALS